MMAQVNLTVNGRVYRMACEDGEEDHVMQLGARFDGAIDELRGALGEIGDQRLMVMAGILMTDRLDDAERRLKRAEQDAAGAARSARRSTSLRALIEGVEREFRRACWRCRRAGGIERAGRRACSGRAASGRTIAAG